LLADFAGREGEDDRSGLRGLGTECDAVLEQKPHHGHEGDAFVAIDEGGILCQSKRIGCCQPSHVRPVIPPFVDRTFECRPQHAFVAQTGCSAEAAQLTAMDCGGLLVADPKRLFRLAHVVFRLF